MKLHRVLDMAQFGLSLDTETYLSKQGLPLPPLVLGSIAWLDPGLDESLPGRERVVGEILSKADTLDAFVRALEDERIILVGANIAMYDLPVLALELARRGVDVLPALFKMLEEDRVFDIQFVEALNAIAHGHLGKDPRTGGDLINPETGKKGMYSLATVTEQNTGRRDAKANDEFRLRYGEFDGTPIEELPDTAKQYPIDDACNTHENGLIQVGVLKRTLPNHRWGSAGLCLACGGNRTTESCQVLGRHDNLHDLGNQTRAAFALKLGGSWGFRINQRRVDIVERHALRRRERLIRPFLAAGIIREDGSAAESKIKRLVALAYGSTEPCETCAGTGRSPSDKQPQVNCGACRGRCKEWKKGGAIMPPTVETCAPCGTSGKVNSSKVKLVGCHGPNEAKTCDGSGLVLDSKVPRTESGEIGIGADAMGESGDEFLMSYGDYLEDKKVLDLYVPAFRMARVPYAGHVAPCEATKKGVKGKKKVCPCPGPYYDVPWVLEYNAILETGRVSIRGIAQLIPRWPGYWEEDATGVLEYVPSLRECIQARAEYEEVDVPAGYVLQQGEEWC
jgi:hypothetical protein